MVLLAVNYDDCIILSASLASFRVCLRYVQAVFCSFFITFYICLYKAEQPTMAVYILTECLPNRFRMQEKYVFRCNNAPSHVTWRSMCNDWYKSYSPQDTTYNLSTWCNIIQYRLTCILFLTKDSISIIKYCGFEYSSASSSLSTAVFFWVCTQLWRHLGFLQASRWC